MREPNSAARRATAISAVVLLLSALLLIRPAPIISFYGNAVRLALGLPSIGSVAVVCGLGLLVLATLLWRLPRLAVSGVASLSLFLVIRSGNFPALLAAGALFGVTLIAGDGIARLLRGYEADDGDL